MLRVIAALFATFMAGCNAIENDAATNRPHESGATFVFDNVRVLTMTDAGVLENARVVIADGKIVSAGPLVGKDVPEGAIIIDGTGKTLMPGLADMHVHYFGEGEGPLYLANSVTTVRNMWGTAETLRLADRVAQGMSTGPNIYTSGPLMDGADPVWGEDAMEIISPQRAEGAIESQRATGYNAVKLYAKLTPETYRAAVAAAKARDMQIWTHVPGLMTVEDVISLEVDSIEHLDGYHTALAAPDKKNSSSIERWQSADPAQMESLAELTAAAGVWNTPTLAVIYSRYIYGDDAEAFFAKPEAALIDVEISDWWRGGVRYYDGTTPVAEDAGARQREFIKALYDAGAGLLIGTDTPNPFVLPGYAIHDELAGFAAAGIPVEDVLRVATVDAARFLGEEDAFGMVAPGLRADLVLLDRDPIADLDTLRDPAGVMVSGRWHARTDLNSMLEARAAELAGLEQAIEP
mgnify:CR=1 FL=1|jgi:imidazolonepropionase-like amidohydrolase